MADTAATQHRDSVLDRSLDLTSVSIWSVIASSVFLVAAALRFAGLDWMALSVDEARRSFLALSLFDGRPLPGDLSLDDASPAMLLGQAMSFLMFGVTDVTARLFPVLAGLGIVGLALLLHPFVGRTAAMGMGVAAAISPALLYASRVANPEMLVAFFSLLAIVAFAYAGRASAFLKPAAGWTGLTGIALACSLASGPSSITVMIAIVAGLLVAELAEHSSGGAVRNGLSAITASPINALALAIGFVAALLVLFSRGFSDFTAISGIADTFRDWGRLLTTESTATPTQLFLLAILLYEALALLGAIVGYMSGISEVPGGLSPVFFLGWFVTALVMFSFSSGRTPEHTVHVALPVVLLGGAGAASVIASLGWRNGRWKSTGLLLATVAGLIAAMAAFIAALGRVSDSTNSGRAAFESIAVLIIAVLPLAIAAYVLLRDRASSRVAGGVRVAGLVAASAFLLFAGAYTLRSTVTLSYYRADTSLELIAQRTSTPAVTALVRQIENLSRDLTVRDPSTQDPTGGHGISIAIESNVEWPYRWYFREFPNVETVEPGAGVSTGADLVIAREPVEMDTSRYTPRLIASRNRVPPEYLTPSFGAVLSSIVLPSKWEEGTRFLLFRDGITRPDAEPVSVGYGQRLSQKLFPSTGPYGINERVGTGSGRGQLNQPRGVAVNLGDGSIYVVDSANGRVQRFDASGAYIGAWGGPESSVTFEVTAEGLGPTGIDLGFEGLAYVADTWAHRIVVINTDGQVVREFGTFGDTGDAQTAVDLPGQFFGPRDVAVTANEIYVVDTGNERVQVFTPDGTFVRSWGGYGSDVTQFIEPVGIAVGPDDRVYVADSGNARISVFARDGTPLAQWPVAAWQGQQYFEPYLAFDQFGRLYATSAGTASVEVFDLEGTLIESLNNAGGEAFEAPIGIALASDGTMRVSDRGKSAVLQIPVIPPEAPAAAEDGSPVAASPVGLEASPVASPIASPVASPVGIPAGSPEE
ncbi:hypothetical protein BH24CHL4_BH24CHL4_07810 [soil metagenome]